MRDEKIKELLLDSCGALEVENYSSYKVKNSNVLVQTAVEMLDIIPPAAGMCGLLSASWVAVLRDNFSIPAIVVAGDLEINKVTVFKCEKSPAEMIQVDIPIINEWDGHCWIEIDGFIGDISIFRTAHTLGDSSRLKNYIRSNFGANTGIMICRYDELPVGMKYIPKFVLTDDQITSLVKGMDYFLKNYHK